ncbi:hypothetical protein V2I01_00820 [Micromonospora sp. BRA006-A]|nr:hypothetical protein [Micromonospora sp. BRA006-A]
MNCGFGAVRAAARGTTATTTPPGVVTCRVMSYSGGSNTNGSPYFSAAVVGTLYNTYANDTW